MNNDTNLTKQQMAELLDKINSQKDSDSKVDINDFVNRNLTQQQAQALGKALENPELIKSLLASPQARLLMKKLLGGDAKK